MLGEAVLYAASRATSTAMENVSRKAVWTAISATFLISGLVFALVLAYWLAQERVGSVAAAGAIAAGCLLVGLISMSMPWMIERAERVKKKTNQSPAATAVAVVDEEAKEAVDYFGALQVVGAAFLFGLGAARRLKR
jgi:hypothetical protein